MPFAAGLLDDPPGGWGEALSDCDNAALVDFFKRQQAEAQQTYPAVSSPFSCAAVARFVHRLARAALTCGSLVASRMTLRFGRRDFRAKLRSWRSQIRNASVFTWF